MKRSCVTELDWGLSLSLLPSGKKSKKRRMIKGRASVGGGYNCRALALPTPSCIFKTDGGESGCYDCCALTLPTPSCIYNSAQMINSLPQPPAMDLMGHPSTPASDIGCSSTNRSLELSLSPPSLNDKSQLPFAWEEVAEASSGESTTVVVVEAPATTTLDGEAAAPLPPTTSSGTSTLVISTVDDQLGGQLAPPRPGTTWQEKARLLNGTPPLRVLEKRLFSTDVSRDHARFLFTKDDQAEGKLPAHRPPHEDQTSKIRERGPRKLLDTLTEAEKETARADGGLPLLLLDRWGNEYGGNKLKFWKSNHSYVILGKWPNFVRLGELESGDAVQVYVFRVPVQAAAAATNASSAAGPDPVLPSEAPASDPPSQGAGRPCMGWSLAVVICSQVAVEEEERRRRESPEDKEARRRLQNLDPAKPRTKKRKISPTGEEGARG